MIFIHVFTDIFFYIISLKEEQYQNFEILTCEKLRKHDFHGSAIALYVDLNDRDEST